MCSTVDHVMVVSKSTFFVRFSRNMRSSSHVDLCGCGSSGESLAAFRCLRCTARQRQLIRSPTPRWPRPTPQMVVSTTWGSFLCLPYYLGSILRAHDYGSLRVLDAPCLKKAGQADEAARDAGRTLGALGAVATVGQRLPEACISACALPRCFGGVLAIE